MDIGGKTMSWEEKVLADTGINNMFYKVQSVSLFLPKMSKECQGACRICQHYNPQWLTRAPGTEKAL